MGVDAMEGEFVEGAEGAAFVEGAEGAAFVEGAEGAAFVEGAKAKGSGAGEAWRMAC